MIMARYMSANGNKVRGLAEEFNIGLMDQFTKDTGKMMLPMEKGVLYTKMVMLMLRKDF